MAKIEFGAIVTGGRGKVGGTVFSNNRYGAYMRNKVIPVNPQTTSQQTVRARFGNRSINWRALTEAQRISWNNAGPDFPYTDIFGNQKHLSGQALYIALNSNLLAAGQTAITDPPVPGTVMQMTALSFTMTNGTPAMSMVFAPSPVTTGNTLIVQATAGVSAGRSFLKSQYRQITTIAAAATTPQNILTAYTTKFGAVPGIGKKVSIRVWAVNNTTGQTSVAFTYTVIIAA